jgi:transcription termination factor Rho
LCSVVSPSGRAHNSIINENGQVLAGGADRNPLADLICNLEKWR